MENYKEIDEVLKKEEIVDRHSSFQLKYFVVGKEPTRQAKLWRCVRELKARREAITSINREIEEVKDNLELTNMDFEELDSVKPSNRRIEINKNKIKRQIEGIVDMQHTLEIKLKYLEEEAKCFLDIFNYLEKIEPLKPFDDMEEQAKYWNEKLSKEIGIKMVMGQPIDIELIKTIMALDSNSPIKRDVSQMLDGQQKKMICQEQKRLAEKGA